MTNISAGGIGLSALAEGEAIPQRGDPIELEVALGEAPLHAVGRVAWTSQVHEGGRLGFGVEFRELSQAGRAQLARFLAAHRPRVVVASAPADERALVEDSLRELDLVFVDDPAQLRADILRNSASVIVFADDVAYVTDLLDELRRADALLPLALPLASVTVVTTLSADALLPLAATERVYEVLRPPLEAGTLVRAIERSCERWALKFELRWASLQLEGAAVRVRAPSPSLAPMPAMPAPMPAPMPARPSFVRASEPMQRVHELIKTVAVHDVPVLLIGETGTGKAFAAREIHALGRRAPAPFIVHDCAASTEALLDRELELAQGGTLLLDEIQDTSPALQATLLHLLDRDPDVRVIAASTIELAEAVARNELRSDLYYRLARFPIHIPALRDRPDDIVPLIRHFVATISDSLERPPPRLEPRAVNALLAHRWPGNVRELRNTIERALLLTPPGEPLRWDALADELRGIAPDPGDERGLDAQVADLERQLIQRALDRHDGVIRRAARDLGVNAVTLARKMKKLGIGEP